VKPNFDVYSFLKVQIKNKFLRSGESRMSKVAWFLAIGLFLSPLTAFGQVGILGTPDGAGVEGLPATSVELLMVNGVAVDEKGRFYISASRHHQVFRIDATGVLTVFAGNQREGFSGDGGPATAAQLWTPHGLAFDRQENLYIADQRNHRVRRVDPAGIISTFVVTGTSERVNPVTDEITNLPAGLAVDGQDNLYIADPVNHRLLKATPDGKLSTYAGTGKRGYSGDGGPAALAQVAGPTDVAVDAAGNVYIADFGNNRVRRIDPSGTISTVAGSGAAGDSGDGGAALKARLRSPSGVAVDSAGNLYIADSNNHRIRKVTPYGRIRPFAGTGVQGLSGDGGPATKATLNRPFDIVIDRSGKLYIVDQDNLRIRMVDPAGGISTVAGKDRYETPYSL
jgi:sugar lactone lactonase YvrE